MTSSSSVHVLDLPHVVKLSEQDLVELLSAYIECHPGSEGVLEGQFQTGPLPMVLAHRVHIAWSDEADEFMFKALDEELGF